MTNRNLVAGILWGTAAGLSGIEAVRLLSDYVSHEDGDIIKAAMWTCCAGLDAGLSIYNLYRANRIRKGLEDE